MDLTNKPAFVFIDRRGTHTITYAALLDRTRAVAAWLHANSRPGDRVILLFPPGLDFISAFLGCLYAGRVAVPLYPPRPNQKRFQFGGVLGDCGATVALTRMSDLALISSLLSAQHSGLRLAAGDDLPAACPEPLRLSEDSLAFLQYTSGSTGTPKGVMVSHGNLIANAATIAEAFQTGPDDVCVSWLPLYHDMGLIGAVVQAIFRGFTSVLMAPASFVRDPFFWLETIHRYGATLAGGPNFCYAHCLSRVSPERLAGLDLSRWRVAFNGAEPVRAETLDRFAAVFAPVGFSPRAFFPCYGMAESTLFAAGGSASEPAQIKVFERESLKTKRADLTAGEDGQPLVACGWAHGTGEIRIVDPESLSALEQGQIGEIWLNGPSVAVGYWGQEALSETTFKARDGLGNGPYLRTGDLGFMVAGQLFVTGRLKDLIIIRGRNHYPQDIEQTSGKSHPALEQDATAAFTVDVGGMEQLVVVQEVKRTAMKKLVTALAEGCIRMEVETLAAIKAGEAPKGEVLQVARLAGIQAGKRTGELIPLCHMLPGTSLSVDVEVDEGLPGIRVRSTATLQGQTGVEMEALTATTIALVTVYDMVKSMDRTMVLEDIRLLSKEGGRSGTWIREDSPGTHPPGR